VCWEFSSARGKGSGVGEGVSSGGVCPGTSMVFRVEMSVRAG